MNLARMSAGKKLKLGVEMQKAKRLEVMILEDPAADHLPAAEADLAAEAEATIKIKNYV